MPDVSNDAVPGGRQRASGEVGRRWWRGGRGVGALAVLLAVWLGSTAPAVSPVAPAVASPAVTSDQQQPVATAPTIVPAMPPAQMRRGGGGGGPPGEGSIRGPRPP